MSDHGHGCVCQDCLSDAFDAIDAMEKMALTVQIQASWHGWCLEEPSRWAGHDHALPEVPTSTWHRQFMDDAPRREMIRVKVEVWLEAQQLLQR